MEVGGEPRGLKPGERVMVWQVLQEYPMRGWEWEALQIPEVPSVERAWPGIGACKPQGCQAWKR